MIDYLGAYKNAIDEEKKSMSETQLAEFEQSQAEERKLIEEYEKTMVCHDEHEFITDERRIDENEEDNKYPEADDPEELLMKTTLLKTEKLDDIPTTVTSSEILSNDMFKTPVKESELKTERVDVKPVLVRAYCPKCGKEIISSMPPMYNPFSFEKMNVHKCSECGWAGNLEHSYPRIVFIDAQNNEYDAYTKA